ncbi:MAG: PCRF domain-containing protein [Planctomycetes bacterium]|nr:PCRF domain-containing protein [Planctomycetota bacterium]
MWEEIEKRGRRYLELQKLIADPTSPARPEYAGWLREYGRMGQLGELFEPYAKAEADLKEAESILKDSSSDAELKEMAQEQVPEARARMDQARAKLLELADSEDLDEDAGRNVIFEIYKGTGGDEAALFAADLFDMYKRYIERKGWKLTVLNLSQGNAGGFNDIAFRVEGAGAFGDLRFEGGGHRVQRVPATETQGRIHTSMVRVAILPEVEEVEVKIDPKDVEEKFCGAGGPGGQNVNKVATQCQLRHVPSGIIVHCMETRSQKTNRERAWQILRAKLYALEKMRVEQERSDQRLGQMGSGERSERIRTYNFPQGRCTDHRLEGDDKNWPVENIIAGRLDELIAKLKAARKRESAGNPASTAN